MSVTVRRYRRGGWEVDIVWRAPDGRCRRERKRLTVDSRSTARRWGEARERELLVNGPAVRKEVPTFSAFWPRFLDGYARANRQKPSGIAAKETIGRVHLQPHFGAKRLDAITTEQVQRLKHALTNRAPKTVNNVLTVLNVVLRKAVEWNVLERMPCTIRLLPIPKPSAGFLRLRRVREPAAGGRVRRPARPSRHAVGRRRGPAVRRDDGAGVERRESAETATLRAAVRLEGSRDDHQGRAAALRADDRTTRRGASGASTPAERARALPGRWPTADAEDRAGLRASARPGARSWRRPACTVLRHTFCSHLAMRGAPARAIQELAGHMDLSTTQRYMHLSPAAIDSAIRLLESSGIDPRRGDIVETGEGQVEKSFR